MFDCHMHTKFSTDSKMKIEEAYETAQNLDMGIIITEHMDYNFPREGEFTFNPKDYFKEYSKYRSDKVLLGVEEGMRPNCVEENRKLQMENPFDCVIGSIHFVDDFDIFYESLYSNRTKNEVYTQYFKCMIECLKVYDFVDTLGHIDYIARYARFDDTNLYYNEFPDLIDEVLKLVIKNNIALEINTRRFGNKEAIESLVPIYKRFYELGGRTVTLGSDSHSANVIGSHFKEALDLAEITNLQPIYFKNRKPEYIKKKYL